MVKLDNLGKENFWDVLGEECPDAVQVFRVWIDDWKKRNGWEQLLGRKVKFHDLPLEMQNGVVARFDLELMYLTNNGNMDNVHDVLMAHREELRGLFTNLQGKIDARKKLQEQIDSVMRGGGELPQPDASAEHKQPIVTIDALPAQESSKPPLQLAIDKMNDRVKYLTDAELEEIAALDALAKGSMERELKWKLINELHARRRELEDNVKEISVFLPNGNYHLEFKD